MTADAPSSASPRRSLSACAGPIAVSLAAGFLLGFGTYHLTGGATARAAFARENIARAEDVAARVRAERLRDDFAQKLAQCEKWKDEAVVGRAEAMAKLAAAPTFQTSERIGFIDMRKYLDGVSLELISEHANVLNKPSATMRIPGGMVDGVLGVGKIAHGSSVRVFDTENNRDGQFFAVEATDGPNRGTRGWVHSDFVVAKRPP